MLRRRWSLIGLTLLLVGCEILGPIREESDLALVVVNGGVDDVTLVVERPGRDPDVIPVQPCSAHSDPVPTDRRWRLDVGDQAVLTLQQVTILVGVPLTVYRVTVTPERQVDIAGPDAADRMPDVPIRFACADE